MVIKIICLACPYRQIQLTTMVPPYTHPQAVALIDDPKALIQAINIGSLQICTPKTRALERDVCMIYSSNPLVADYPGNRRVDGQIVSGTFYLVGLDEDIHIVSISDEKLSKYMIEFWEPEAFSFDEVVDDDIAHLLRMEV